MQATEGRCLSLYPLTALVIIISYPKLITACTGHRFFSSVLKYATHIDITYCVCVHMHVCFYRQWNIFTECLSVVVVPIIIVTIIVAGNALTDAYVHPWVLHWIYEKNPLLYAP